ncbi:hypothetical protein C8Q73DRAFT_664746 [Cubamyces lactineus]|nr:hypothetical protein C8Q73DRAFT_664746 [Cubamyces lactineus]
MTPETSPSTSFEQSLSRRNELVQQREALSHEIVVMSRTLNAARPINRLPKETLAEIFHQLQVRRDFSFEKNEWYTVAAVCKHWYEVANSCASLWRRMSFDTHSGLSIANEFSVGSSGASLLREWGRPAFAWAPVDTAMLNRRFDVQYHRLHAAVCTHEDNFRRLFERYAPLTELLELKCDNVSLRNDEGYLDPEFHNPDDLDFSDRHREALQLPVDPNLFPCLRYLSLITASIKPNPVPLPSLRRLQLSNCARMTISIDEFLVFISGCTALEELYLRTFRPADPAFPGVAWDWDLGSGEPLAPNTLPATLEKLYIHDFPPFTARMLEGMAVSKATELTVSVNADADTDDDAYDFTVDPPLYTALPKKRTHMDVLHGVMAIHVRFDTPTVYRIVARTSREHGPITIAAVVPSSTTVSQEYLPDIFTDLVELYGSEPIIDLTIVATNTNLWTKIEETDWADVLRPFSQLEHLGVLFHPDNRLPRAGEDDPLMTLMSVLGGSQEDEDKLCPKLKCLTLHSSDVKPSASASRTERIMNCLRSRKAHGQSLDRLSVVHERNSESVKDLFWAEMEHINNIVTFEDAARFWTP